MFLVKYLFYFIFTHLTTTSPQLNLHFTINEVSEDKYNDRIRVGYNCFHVTSNMHYANLTRQISSYCMSESSFKFHIQIDSSLQTFSFADLEKMNITSDDLYFCSTPIDTIEKYKIYLKTQFRFVATDIS